MVRWGTSIAATEPELVGVHWTTDIYGHRNMKARLPVRSALVKHVIARLVLQWVTMRESLVP